MKKEILYTMAAVVFAAAPTSAFSQKTYMPAELNAMIKKGK